MKSEHDDGAPSQKTAKDDQDPAAEANGVVSRESDDDPIEDEIYNYNRVPPRRVVTYKVRIKVIGRGKPLPYPLDEDDDE